MHLKVNSFPCSFHLLGNILWDWLKALSGLAGASQLPNGSAESVAQHLSLLIYWSKGVFTESYALPPFQEKPPVLHSLWSPESSVMGSISHYEQTAKCIWNGKFLMEMGISELPAACDPMAKQLQCLQSLCRRCLSNNQDSFKYLFETGWFQVSKSTGFPPLCLIETGSWVLKVGHFRALQVSAKRERNLEMLGFPWKLNFEDLSKQMWRFRGGIRSRAKLPRCFSVHR